MTIYIRTRTLCGDKDKTSDNGTVKLTQRELSKLGCSLGMCLDEINDKLIELKRKGEIKGYGSNFKVLRKDGITQPELLEVTGRKARRRNVSNGVTRCTKKIGRAMTIKTKPKIAWVGGYRYLDNGIFLDGRKKTLN